jgi:hypothetical protein
MQAVVVVAIGSCHGFACPLPMLQTLTWCASTNARGIQSSPPRCPAGEQTVGRAGAALPDAKRVCTANGIDDIRNGAAVRHNKDAALGGAGPDPLRWQREEAESGSPLFLTIDDLDSSETALPVFVRVQAAMHQSADAELQLHTFTVKVDRQQCILSDSSSLRAESTWVRAADSAAMLQITTQVTCQVRCFLQTDVIFVVTQWSRTAGGKENTPMRQCLDLHTESDLSCRKPAKPRLL